MGNHDLAEFGVGGGYVFTDRRIDGEPVILGGYFDFAGGFIHDGLVDTAVSKGQLVGTEPERTPEKLIAKAGRAGGKPRGVVRQLPYFGSAIAKGGLIPDPADHTVSTTLEEWLASL